MFSVTKTIVSDVYGMNSDKQFVKIIEDNIRQRGMMNTLISESEKLEISIRVKYMLRALFVDDWKSKACH